MKKTIIAILLLTITFISNLSANTFTFNGTGNWNDATKWSPVMPLSFSSIADSIIINGNCTVQNTDEISIPFSLTYIVNGTLVNNGSLEFLGHFYIAQNGNCTNNNLITGRFGVGSDDVTWQNEFINNGNFTNNGSIIIDGSEPAIIINNGYFYNNNLVESGGIINNYGKIISTGGDISSYGRQFFNYDTIIGKLHTGYLANFGVLSPGFSAFDTDTMFCVGQGLSNYNIVNIDVNSPTDYDVVVIEYGNNLETTSGIVVRFNPNFTPTITDTFTLVYALNEGNSPFKMARNNMTLPAPPVGFTWKVIYETQAMKLTLAPSTALPYENLTFKAIQKANHVELNWNVTSIENVANFDIERADENKQFTKIGSVEGSEKLDYSFVDTKPNTGINQYRLKAIDIDGKYQYSYIVNVDFSMLKNEIINTIVENNLYININAEESIAIFNEVGQLVSNHIILDGQTTISLNHLSNGIYFVQTNNATYKILKL